MQSSRDVIINAIEFKTPDRLPVMFDALGVSDAAYVNWNQIGTGDRTQEHTIDEWGCGWERIGRSNMGQITGHPIPEWSALDAYRWPDPDDPAFFEGMEARFEGTEGKYVMTGIFMLLFERMHGLRGFANLLEDLYLEPDMAAELADRIVDFDIRMIRNIAAMFPGRIDGFSFTDDWGTETALFINPKLWREFFMPRYKRIFDECHKAGWHVWMHSCGKVNDIIGSLIEIGCDVLNLQQPRALGIEVVGSAYAGRICFQSLCDIQHTLPFKDNQAIEEEAALLLERWGTAKGGFILGDYGDGAAIGVGDDKKRVMYDAFIRFDRWRQR